MYVLLSCAKKQESPEGFAARMPDNACDIISQCRQPRFQQQANVLIEELKPLSAQHLQSLMRISPQLAECNAARFQSYKPGDASLGDAIPALWFFAGDAYKALDAPSLSTKSLRYLDQHLVILSGLYGFLSAFDWVQPYRLEMKTRLANPKGSHLYAYWQQLLTESINKGSRPIVNLASAEYSQVLDKQQLRVDWVDIIFYNKDRSGSYKVIGLKAKKARGDMLRWMAQKQINHPQDLQKYNRLRYRFISDESTPSCYVFREEF